LGPWRPFRRPPRYYEEANVRLRLVEVWGEQPPATWVLDERLGNYAWVVRPVGEEPDIQAINAGAVSCVDRDLVRAICRRDAEAPGRRGRRLASRAEPA